MKISFSITASTKENIVLAKVWHIFLELGHIKRHVYVYLKPTDPKVRNLCFWACFLIRIVTKCNCLGILSGRIHSKSISCNSRAIERRTMLTLCHFIKNIWGSC